MIENTEQLKETWFKQIDVFEQAVKDFLSQKISDGQFQRLRLQHGVYGQRQDGVQMIRIKIPSGGMSAEQFECIAGVCEKYSKGIAHITTRQDIQIHFVKVTDTPALMRDLGNVGITTREACGNTVRNVTACPYAGVSASEPFDVTPYANAYALHFLWNPICQNFGRKFKVAFEGCDHDHARLYIHDLGFWARIKDGKKGFKVVIGGGLGATPFPAHEWTEFMPVEEIIPFSEAVMRVFDRYGERKIRSKARMKFVIKKFGWDKFKELVEAERANLKVDPQWNNYLKGIQDAGETGEHEPAAPGGASSDEYEYWKKTSVSPQRQAGYSIVDMRLPLGDMTPDQMRRLAALTRTFSNGHLRVTIEQDMVLRWIRDEDLPSLYQELKAINMHHADADTVYDVLACPGTDTCRLGISGSRPLATVLEERLKAANGIVSELAKDIHIKISGCPNSCGQHHLGQIGYHGAALPQKGHIAPAFQLHLGGGVSEKGTTIGQIIMKIPSKQVPDATVKLIEHYAAERQDGETFNEYYARFGKPATKELLQSYAEVPAFADDPSFYNDWADEKEFGLQQGVVGECAGSPVADVAPTLAEAVPVLEQARALLTHGEHEAASAKAYEALAKTVDAVLYTKMVQTFVPAESIQQFDNHFVRTGEFPELDSFRYEVDAWRADASADNAQALVAKAEQVMQLCRAKGVGES